MGSIHGGIWAIWAINGVVNKATYGSQQIIYINIQVIYRMVHRLICGAIHLFYFIYYLMHESTLNYKFLCLMTLLLSYVWKHF
jgi:hypothetical protein